MHYTIPKQMITKVWHEYSTHSTFYMCRQLLSHKILSCDFEFYKNSKKFVPSLQVQDTVAEYWNEFVTGFMDHVIAFGFAVVQFQTDSVGRIYPLMVNPQLVSINIHIDNNVQSYSVDATDMDLDTVCIYAGFGFDPVIVDGVGRLTSLASKVMPLINFLHHLRSQCMVMEYNKSNPFFFSEIVDTSRERQEGIDFDYYADADAADMSEDMQYERNRVNVEILKKQQEMYATAHRTQVPKAGNRLQNVVTLPTGHRIVQTPQNTGRQDLVQLHKVINEQICTTLGVPRSMLIADGQYKSDTEGTRMLYDTTLRWWKNQIETTLTDIYTKNYLQNVQPKKNIYLAKQRHRVNVRLSAGSLPYAQLVMLYESGVLQWEPYSKMVMSLYDLPDTYRSSTAPILDRKRKRDANSSMAYLSQSNPVNL